MQKAPRSPPNVSVLGLVQEYEKRLLSKDQEVKAAQLAVRRLEAELHDARAEAREAAAAAAHMLPAPEPKQGALAGMSDKVLRKIRILLWCRRAVLSMRL